MFDDGAIEFSNKTDKLDQVSLEKIFDRYYTVRNARKSNGIGLSIAKHLIDLNNGKIEAKYKNNRLIIRVKFWYVILDKLQFMRKIVKLTKIYSINT